MRRRCNLLVCGGTGSGKTTLLNALSSFIDPGERVVTIEDAAELRLRQPHVLRLEARPPNLEGRGEVTIRRLVRNALRMRPDRIVVGEVRGPEALDMLTALSTGHDGSLCTVHAGSAAEALRRLETLALMADVGLPHAAIREQVADAIDLVVCQARAADGTRRVTGVAEVVRVAGRRRGAGHLHAARRAADVAGSARRRARDPARARVSPAALLAAAAAAAGVLGTWDVLATAEAARLGDRSALAVAPLGRARHEGRAPSGPERRRLGLLAAGSLFAAGWIVGGPLLGAAAALAGPAAVLAAVRARRARYREEVRRGRRRGGTGAGRRDRRRAVRARRAGRGRAGAPGRRRARAATRRRRALAGRADRRRARAPARACGDARVGHARRRDPAAARCRR